MGKQDVLNTLKALPIEELEALLKLKQSSTKSKGGKHPSKVTLPRQVTHNYACKLCGGTRTTHYKIQVTMKASASTSLTPLTLWEDVLTCEECHDTLMSLSKEAIIERALNTIQSLVPAQHVHRLPREVKG